MAAATPGAGESEGRGERSEGPSGSAEGLPSDADRSQALMRMSTPAGMFKLLSASTVWLVGSEM